MQYVRLGSAGLKVSKLCLGCMSYGSPAWREWVLDESASRPFIKQALDGGINFFDTADMYSLGASEEVLGRTLLDYAPRDEVVIATKVNYPMSDKPNARGLSRKHILASIDASLKRLGTDHVDLYVIHRFDPETPIEETIEALDTVVRSGRARYIGASSMHGWQFMRMLALQEQHGLANVCVDAEPLQPDLPRGRAGNAAAVPRVGHRRHPLVAAGAWLAGWLTANPDRAGQHRPAGAPMVRPACR